MIINVDTVLGTMTSHDDHIGVAIIVDHIASDWLEGESENSRIRLMGLFKTINKISLEWLAEHSMFNNIKLTAKDVLALNKKHNVRQ